MSSLARCLKKLGLTGHEAAILKGKVEEYRDGRPLGGGFGTEAALREVLMDLMDERKELVAQVEKQGGRVPEHARMQEVVAEIEATGLVGDDKRIPPPEKAPEFELGQQQIADAPVRAPLTGPEPPLLSTPDGVAPAKSVEDQPVLTQQLKLFQPGAAYEVDAPLYHVTTALNAKAIQKEGFKTNQPSNWVRAADAARASLGGTAAPRYGNGEVFAFTDELDALRWAGRMDWELNKDVGSGRIVVVKFRGDGLKWSVDKADPLSQASGRGPWVKSKAPVPADRIESVTVYTQDMARETSRRFNESFARQPNAAYAFAPYVVVNDVSEYIDDVANRPAVDEWALPAGLNEDGTVTLLHGTTASNAAAILRDGFTASNPAAVAAMVEKEYGLPPGSVLNHRAFEFPKHRNDLHKVHFTTDFAVALQYTVPEQLQDALTAAYWIQHPEIADKPHKDVQPEMERWVKKEGRRLAGEPRVLSVVVPWRVIGEYGFGRKMSLEEYRNKIGDRLHKQNFSIPVDVLRQGAMRVEQEQPDAAYEAVTRAPSVRPGFEPEFSSESRRHAPTGAPGSVVEKAPVSYKVVGGRKGYEAREFSAYDAKGKLAGTLSVVVNGDGKGAFKIAVREDAQRQGWGSKLLDAARYAGVEMRFAENRYTPSGRALVLNWLSPKSEVDRAAARAEQPTEAQAEAGNYQKGHVLIGPKAEWTKPGPNGKRAFIGGQVELSIETAAGERRDPAWPPLKDHYGYIKGSVGFDKDHLDVFIAPGTPADIGEAVYVVNQTKADRTTFDEHKVVIGQWLTPEVAELVYRRNYEDGWNRYQSVVPLSWTAFRRWALDDSKNGPKGGALTYERAAELEEEIRRALPEGQGSDQQQGGAPAERDVLTPSALPGGPEVAVLAPTVKIEKQRDIRLPLGLINSPTDAVYAFAQTLGKWPREKFQMLGVNTKGKPVAFFDLFAGTVGQTSVYPREVYTTLFMTPGISGVWFAHNHPSGIAVPSQADLALTRNLTELLGPAKGVTYRGHVIIGGMGRAYVMKPNGDDEIVDIPQNLPEAWQKVPVIERVMSAEPVLGDALTSPKLVREYIVKTKPQKPGLLLLTAQHQVLGWWGDLSNGLTMPAVRDIVRMVGEHNPAAAILYSPTVGAEAFLKSTQDIRQTLAALDVRVLDAFTLDLSGFTSSAAERGLLEPEPRRYFSLGAGTGMTEAQVHDELKGNLLARAMGRRVRVARTSFDLPEYALAAAIRQGVNQREIKGYFDPLADGDVWLVASNLKPGEAMKTLLHEAVGHYGVSQVLGKDGAEAYDAALLDIYKARSAQIRREATTGFLRAYRLDLTNREHQLTAAAEWIAHEAELGKEQTLWQAFVARVREILRAAGFVRDWTENDILHLLQLARSSLINGARETFNGMPAYHQAGPMPIWYSALSKAIEEKGPNKATITQWRRFISNLQGVKKEEIEWSGIEHWFMVGMTGSAMAGKLDPQVTKQAILSFLETNGVRIEERILGEAAPASVTEQQRLSNRMNELVVRLDSLGFYPEWHIDNGSLRAVTDYRSERTYLADPEDRVEDYLTPTVPSDDGGVAVEQGNTISPFPLFAYNNLPSLSRPGIRALVNEIRELAPQTAAFDGDNINQNAATRYGNSKYVLPGGEEQRELVLYWPKATPWAGEDSSHYGDLTGGRGIAWMRFNTRHTVDGKRFMHIEEFQSKRGEAGRDDGFFTAAQEEERQAILDKLRALRKYGMSLDELEKHFAPGAIVRSYGGMDQVVAFHRGADGSWGVTVVEINVADDLSRFTQQGSVVSRARGPVRISPEDAKTLTVKVVGRSRIHSTDPSDYVVAELESKLNRMGRGVPAMPFVMKTEAWTALVVKRAIRYAAENGFDGISWTTGKQQADRYSLHHEVTRIEWDNTRSLPTRAIVGPGIALPVRKKVNILLNDYGLISLAVGPDGVVRGASERSEFFCGKHLKDVVGPEPTAQIMAAEHGTLQGDGLEMGGEGMREYYDKIVRNVVNDVVPKLGGGRVRTVELLSGVYPYTVYRDGDVYQGADTLEEAHEIADELQNEDRRRSVTVESEGDGEPTLKQMGFDITPAMKEAALRGMPLFALRPRVRSGFGEYEVTPDVARLMRRMEALERRVDAAYERGDPKAEDLDAELAEVKELLTSRTADLMEGEPGDTDFDMSTFEEQAAAAWYRYRSGEWTKDEYLSHMRGRDGPLEPVPADTPDQLLLDAGKDAFDARLARAGRRARRDQRLHNVYRVGPYTQPELRDLVLRVKGGAPGAVQEMAAEMARLVPAGAVLVPVPSRSGRATYTLDLARELARLRPGVQVADVLRGNKREALFDLKKRGVKVTPEMLGFRLAGKLPQGQPLLVDNVLATGTTARAALAVLPHAKVLVHAVDPRKAGAFSLREPQGINEVYGVKDGRLLAVARREYGRGVWNVYIAAGGNERLWAQGEFRRDQAANIGEVQRLFNREGLELRATKPRNIPVPDVGLFDQDWVAPTSDSWLRRSIVYFQNRLLLPELYERQIAAEVGPIPQVARAHREARLAHPRAAGKIADFDHDFTDRLVDIMKAEDLSLKDVGLYLYALHAPERNAYIESVNPENLSGSGMPTVRAEQLIEAFQSNDQKWAALQKVGAIVNEVRAFREALLVEKGLAKREAVLILQSKYPNYVPLKEIVEDEYAQGEVGGGYQVGRLVNAAFGRFTEAQAEFILPGLISQAKGTIAAGENAEVLRAFLRLVEFAPNPAVWRVKKFDFKPYIDKDTGMMMWAPRRPDPRNIIDVPVDGERVTVEVADQQLAHAFNSSGLQLGDTLELLGVVTRFYALMATAANPEFVIVNAMRDFQQAMIRISGEQNTGLAMKVARDMLPALWGAFAGLRESGQIDANAGTWHRWYRRYIEAGGHIAYRGLQDVETQHKDFIKALADVGIYPVTVGGVTKLRLRAHRGARMLGAKAMAKLVIDVNGAVENALRLSAFKNAVEAGWNEKDAAMLARTVTVDFNLKGEAGTVIGSLYMFFNANLQGSALLFRSVINHRAIKGAVMLLFFLGMLMDWWNDDMAEKTADGRNHYDNISDAIKERNLVVMAPDGQNAITVPLPFGFNVFYVAGVHSMSVRRGTKTPLDAARAIFVTFINAFNPFGQSPESGLGALQLITPTAFDSTVQAVTNRNFMDRAIKPERPRGATPQSAANTYFAGTPEIYVDIAAYLNSATGGNEVRSGWADVSPNMLQHWVRSVFGSAGAFAARVAEGSATLATGKEVPMRDVPFLRRFYYEPKDFELSHRFYKNVNAAEVAHREVQVAMQAGDPARASAMRDQFAEERKMFGEAMQVERQVAQMRQQMAEIRRNRRLDDGAKKDRLSKIEGQARDAMMRFNLKFEESARR